MGTVPFAFSVHHFINSVGADAGFAAIIGLAILILLYFAQARETATLRDHAYEAAQRIQQLEGRIAQYSRQPGAVPATGQHVPAQPPAGAIHVAPIAPAPVPAGVAVAPAVPAAPAGVGAPALTAATRLIPTPGPAPLIADARGQMEPQAEPAVATVAAAAPVATAVAPGLSEPPDATAIASPPPATAAGGANGTTHDRIPPPAPAQAQAQAPATAVAEQIDSAPAPPPPRVQIRPGAAAARRPVLPPAAPGRSPVPRVLLVLLGLLGIGAAVAVLLVVTSSGGGTSAQTATKASRTTNAPAPRRPKRAVPAFQPSTVTIAVLNGTSVSNLAHRVAQRLTGQGYKQGTIATASDQTQANTIVAYLPGHRADAVHVAASLKLASSAVRAIDSNTQAVACPPPASCSATVVVTVGSDLANTP